MSKYSTLNDSSDTFLRQHDREMLLNGPAAVEACRRADSAGLYIVRVEGGQWLNPGIMARLDSIWCLSRSPSSRDEAREWNLSAAEFITDQVQRSPDPNMAPADAFILMARKAEF